MRRPADPSVRGHTDWRLDAPVTRSSHRHACLSPGRARASRARTGRFRSRSRRRPLGQAGSRGHGEPAIRVRAWSGRRQSGADGSFAFNGVPPGSYELGASVEGFRAEPARVTVGAAETVNADIRLTLAALTDAVVVSAAYVESPQSEATASVTALSRRDIDDRQITMVADALRLAPGMTVAPSGGLGSVTSAFPRGGESDYTLVMVDGVKLNAFGGGFDFGHLTTFGLGQLEVVRGPQSAVFGSDAIGGVIQMRSRVGGRPSAYGLLETGSYGTNRMAAGSSGSKGAGRLGRDRGTCRQRRLDDGGAGPRSRHRVERRLRGDLGIARRRLASGRAVHAARRRPLRHQRARQSRAVRIRSHRGVSRASIACRAARTTRAWARSSSRTNGTRGPRCASSRATSTSDRASSARGANPTRGRGGSRRAGRSIAR